MHKLMRIAPAPLVLALALPLAACKPDDSAQVSTSKPTEPQSAAMPGQQDAWTTTAIQSKFFMNDDVKSQPINVSTKDGVVTLTGTIASSRARAEAVDLARATPQVVRVDDKMVAPDTNQASLPPVKNDVAPAAAAAAAAGGTDQQASGTGQVATSGTTTPEPHRPVVAPGEALRVTPEQDAALASRIEAKFFGDERLRSTDVQASVKGGIVTLTGHVRDADVKARAQDLAREAQGTARVDNQIQTVPPKSSGTDSSSVPPPQ